MVYIVTDDGKERKYACMTCIRGHRSTKCFHTNRELFEIKKKGRPISQCESCRQLRRTKQMHVKCKCHTKEKDPLESSTSPSSSTQLPRLSQLNLEANQSCMQCDQPPSSCVCAQSPSNNSSSSISRNLEYGQISSSSSEGTITPPCDPHSSSSTTTSHPAGLGYTSSPLLSTQLESTPPPPISVTTTSPTIITTATTTTTNNLLPIPNTTTSTPSTTPSPPSPSNLFKPTPKRHLVIPIHDPTDDMDSDTPIYKSEETVISDQTAVLGELTHKSSEELMNQIYSGFMEDKDRQSCKMVNEVNEFEEHQE